MRRRIYYSTEQRREIWDRWKRGESAHEIGRLFDRPHSSIFKILMATGGLRPPERRSLLAHFKCPTRVVFEPLPKTSTGKIQKFVLREKTTKML